MPDKAYKELSKHLDRLYDDNGLTEENREKWIRFVCDELKYIAERIDELGEKDEDLSNELGEKFLEILNKLSIAQAETKLSLSEVAKDLSETLNKSNIKLVDAINKINIKVTTVGAKYGAISAIILNILMWIVIYLLKDHIFKG